MNPAFEDMFLGPLASPSFSQGLRFRWEDSRRRVRVVFGGITVADSTRVMLLHEFGRLPVFYFPMLETGLPTHYYLPEQDVRIDLLEPTETANRCPYKRKASYWSATIGDQVFKDIAWSYRDPLPACSPISNLLCFFNERADAIYVDDERQSVPSTPWSDDQGDTGGFPGTTEQLSNRQSLKHQFRAVQFMH